MTEDKSTWPKIERLLGTRTVVFLYNIVMLTGAGALALYYFNDETVDGLLPARLQGVPVYAVWFGALGGLAISLKGCYDHRLDWTDDWSVWHYGRVFSGALAGGVTYVLLLALNIQSASATREPAAPIVAAAAFILGTQEARFFNFLFEVGKLIVHVPEPPGGTLAPPVIDEVTPLSGSAGRVVTVSGSGFRPGARASFGGVALDDAQINDAGTEIRGKAPTHALGMVQVVVSNPDNSAHVRSNGFEYTQEVVER